VFVGVKLAELTSNALPPVAVAYQSTTAVPVSLPSRFVVTDNTGVVVGEYAQLVWSPVLTGASSRGSILNVTRVRFVLTKPKAKQLQLKLVNRVSA
jgi:hypothetical protein